MAQLLPQTNPEDQYTALMAQAQQNVDAARNPVVAPKLRVDILPDGTPQVIDLETNQPAPGFTARLPNEEELANGIDPSSYVVDARDDRVVLSDDERETTYRYGTGGSVWRYDKAGNYEQEITVQEGVPDALKRVVAGAAFPFVDSPGDFGINGYFPAGVEAIPATVYGLANLLPGVNIQNDYLEGALERTGQADADMRQFLRITPPENLGDVALEVGGALLVPGPKAGRVGSGAVNTAGKPLNALGHIPNSFLSGRSGGLLQGASDIAMEAFLPLRQGTLGGALATQVPLGIGISETIDTAIDDPNYTSIPDVIQEATQQPVDVLEALPSDIRDMYNTTDDEVIKNEILDILEQGLNEGSLTVPEAPDPAWRTPLTTAAAFAATGLGVLGIRSAMQASARNRLQRPADSLVGRRRLMEGSSLTSRAQQGWFQSDQTLRDALRASDAPTDIINRLTRNQPAPLVNIISHTINTGEFPNSAVRARPVSPLLQAIGKDLSVEEHNILANGLAARSALDDINSGSPQAAFNDKTPAELEAIALLAENNPRTARYIQPIRDTFRAPLEYALEQGVITQEAFNELIAARPNYVPLGRNASNTQAGDTLFAGSRFSPANRQQIENLMKRSDEEWGGVQVGEANDPIRAIPNYVASIIRRVENNTARRDFFDATASNAALDDVIVRVPVGEVAKTGEGLHTVYRDGKPEHFLIRDNALDTALRFNPAVVQNQLLNVVGMPTRLIQSTLTGPLAPLFAPTSAMYDLLGGVALRPKGYDLGLISEMSNNLIPHMDDWAWPGGRSGGAAKETLRAVGDRLKSLDPTILVTPLTGATRLAWDEFLGGSARALTVQLEMGKGPLIDALGTRWATTFRDHLENAYAASYKSQMDRQGATTSGLLASDEMSSAPRMLADTAPNFYTRAMELAAEDAMNGNPNTITQLLNTTNKWAAAGRTNPLVRTYLLALRLMNEGTRYQAFATNAPRALRSAEDAQEVGNQTRRLSSDVMQRGGSELVAGASKGILYLNPALQGMAQVGRQLKDQPVTTALNTLILGSAMAAIQYNAANDEATQEYIRSLTPEQQASRVVLAPDVFINVPHELRPLWGPFSITMNELTGINAGDYDRSFSEAFGVMLDGSDPLDGEGEGDVNKAFIGALNEINPFNLGSIPLFSAGAAALGQDVGMSRYAGSPQEVRSQEVSGLGGDGQLSGDPISAEAMKVTENLLSSVVATHLRTSMDIYRALEADVDAEGAFEIGLSRLTDQTARRSGPIRGLLFGDYIAEQSANTVNSRRWHSKRDGIDSILTIIDKDYRNAEVTSQGDQAQLRPLDVDPVQLQGTAMIPIMGITNDLNSTLRDYRSAASNIQEAIQDVRNQSRTTIEERNQQINDYRDDLEELTTQMLMVTRQAEEMIRQQIGDPSFSYQEFDPERYMNMPLAASPQAMGSPQE